MFHMRFGTHDIREATREDFNRVWPMGKQNEEARLSLRRPTCSENNRVTVRCTCRLKNAKRESVERNIEDEVK